MPAQVIVIALTMLLGVQVIATDLYLPALPTMVTALGTTVSRTQLTLSALVIAFGFAQLVCGPLADRFGRRPVLLSGLLLYTLASTGAASAPDIEWLVAMRILQGAAMAAAVTCGRSLIRDLFEPHEGARVMSKGLTGLGIIAIVSPIIGSVAVAAIHWRAPLAATALFGAIALAYCFWNFRETVPRYNPEALRPLPLLRSWCAIVRHPTFLAYASLGACTYVGLFVILIGSSFVYIDVFGMGKLGYGFVMTVNAICYTFGTVLCRRLLARRGLRATVAISGVLSFVSAIAIALVAFADLGIWWLLALPQWAYSIAHGAHQPCSQAGAIGPFPATAGTASALSGFVMMAAAFITGLAHARAFDGTPMAMAVGVAGAGIATALIAWTAVQRHGEPRPIPAVIPEPT